MIAKAGTDESSTAEALRLPCLSVNHTNAFHDRNETVDAKTFGGGSSILNKDSILSVIRK